MDTKCKNLSKALLRKDDEQILKCMSKCRDNCNFGICESYWECLDTILEGGNQ